MKLLEDDLLHTAPIFCRVNPDYASYLHQIDYRVSTKWQARAYIGLAVYFNGRMYVVPLSSQTTLRRAKRGLYRRNSQVTTFIYHRNTEIANLLHNNMIPVPESEIIKIEIDPAKDVYLSKEQRYVRRHWVEINNKSIEVYQRRYDPLDPNYAFLEKTCCDFRALEAAYDEWVKEK